jgi:hypothetical protein
MTDFRRGIRKPGMIDALAELAGKESWWRDVLRDKSLVIGVRDDYLNVYWRGQSLFKVEMKDGRIVASTHPKYLLNPELSGQVKLDSDGEFCLGDLDVLTRAYVPGNTLGKLKRAASLFAGDEKIGVQAIAAGNANVVDVEIAFPAAPGGRSVPRIDIATFERAEGGVKLVFWEAKLLGNPELRTCGEKNVCDQIASYAGVLGAHAASVLDSYRVVARNLMAFAEMSNGERTVAEEIASVATNEAGLILSEPADVRLVVYGFDAAQRDKIWKPLLEALETTLGSSRILARGEPSGLKLQPRSFQ